MSARREAGNNCIQEQLHDHSHLAAVRAIGSCRRTSAMSQQPQAAGLTQRELSDKIFNITTSPSVYVSRDATKAAKSHRKWLLAQIRNAVVEDGKVLVSPSDDAAFSQHGSLFHRLHVHGTSTFDIDVYVVLNGAHLTSGTHSLDGRPREPNNLGKFQFPLHGDAAAAWMCTIVRRVIGDRAVVKQTRRGATFEDFGPKKRSYDIIPAFMYKEDGNVFHIIPNEKGWEVNPTTRDMQTVIDLDREFSRDSDRKVLGYRDLVKLLKRLKDILGWGASHGITSFMIRFAVSETLERSSSRYNHKQLAAAIDQLQRWFDQGYFPDPYAQPQKLQTQLAPLNEQADGLSPKIWDVLFSLKP